MSGKNLTGVYESRDVQEAAEEHLENEDESNSGVLSWSICRVEVSGMHSSPTAHYHRSSCESYRHELVSQKVFDEEGWQKTHCSPREVEASNQEQLLMRVLTQLLIN